MANGSFVKSDIFASCYALGALVREICPDTYLLNRSKYPPIGFVGYLDIIVPFNISHNDEFKLICPGVTKYNSESFIFRFRKTC